MMKVTAIDLKNFKSVHEAHVDGLSSINVFFGPTNSGKTSILEAVYFQCNHQRITNPEGYKEFLHSKVDPNNAEMEVSTQWEVVESIPAVNLRTGDRVTITTHVVFSGGEPVMTETVSINNAAEDNDDRIRALLLILRGAVKLSSSRRPGDSKNVYFPGPEETVEQRKRRFLEALHELELQGDQYQEFLSRMQKMFPHLVYDMQNKENILEFFGMGFLGTAKLFIYLFDARYSIVLIDEPEIHFYPSLTKRFVSVLHEVVGGLQKQILLGTHSTLFLHERGLGNFYHMTKTKHFLTNVRKVEQGKLLEGIDLLNAPAEAILQSDMVIYVEGPWDVGVMEEFIAKFPELDYVNMIVLQLGGGSMGNMNIDPVKLKLHNPLSFVIIDSERQKANGVPEVAHQSFSDRCREAKVYCCMLDRRAMENYFPPRALRTVFGDRIPAHLVNQPFKPLTEQGLPWYEKKSDREVAHAMTKEEIESFPDLKAFFDELRMVSRQIQ